ncbi:MAG: hypothetical protein CL609_02620 [Anaerolineaceae bacterium]|nr:hypothetical protein [Anaerolineaceae bacterium]
MDGITCFSGATIIVGTDFEVIQNASVNVENGRILSIGEPIPGAVEVDLESGLICPMFINAHCHIGDTGAKELGIGIPMEEVVSPPDGLKHRFLSKLNREDQIAQMRHGLLEMLSNGTIACGDFREQGLEGVLRLREAANGLPIYLKILGRVCETATESELELEAIELLNTADGFGVRDVDCYSAALLKRLQLLFPEKLFAVHVAENEQAEAKSVKKFGRGQALRALDWNPDILVHLTHTSKRELREIKASGVNVVACPQSNSILGDGFPNLKGWLDEDLTFGLGTDNLMATAPNMLREMSYTSRMIRGISKNAGAVDSKTILMAATIMGAKVLNLEKDLGSLSRGKLANFLVFDLNSRNLKYNHDPISALVNRAGVNDIKTIYIKGVKYK